MGCFDGGHGGFGAYCSADSVACREESVDDLAGYKAIRAWVLFEWGFQRMFLMADIPVTRTVCSDGEAIGI